MGILLFRGSEPDVYLKTDIYDPDIHGLPAVAPEGLTVPAIGSLVIDGDVGNRVLWVVDRIEDISFEGETVPKVYLIPADVIDDGDSSTRLVSYGNDTLMLYYDDRSTPTRCVPDSKFVCIGGSAAEYRLVKTINNEEVVISLLLDNVGSIIGDRIPIVDSSIEGIRTLEDCYTANDLDDGDIVTIQIFDSAGVMTTTAKMTCKRSTILNDLVSSSNPIVGFDANANQIDGANFIVYLGQNPEDLTLWPEIAYSDGQREIITIDGINTFVYGLDEVNSDVIGLQFPILIKHFLASDIAATIALGEGARYIQVEKNVLIVPRVYSEFTKIGVAPVYSSGTGEWSLQFIGYYASRDNFKLINPGDVTYVTGTFDGSVIGSFQEFTIGVPYVNESGNTVQFTQDMAVKVEGIAHPEPFLVAEDLVTTFVYGEESLVHKRPTIQYDGVRETYFIPTSRHADLAEFLDDFYDRSAPPFLAGTEIEAPTPTHFILRSVTNGMVLTPTPIDVTLYDQEMTLVTSGGPDQYLNQHVIVEFLSYNGTSYDVLFGMGTVPVGAGTYNV